MNDDIFIKQWENIQQRAGELRKLVISHELTNKEAEEEIEFLLERFKWLCITENV